MPASLEKKAARRKREVSSRAATTACRCRRVAGSPYAVDFAMGSGDTPLQ